MRFMASGDSSTCSSARATARKSARVRLLPSNVTVTRSPPALTCDHQHDGTPYAVGRASLQGRYRAVLYGKQSSWSNALPRFQAQHQSTDVAVTPWDRRLPAGTHACKAGKDAGGPRRGAFLQ